VTGANVWTFLVAAGALAAQPSLRITSPAAGTVVNPGGSIKVVVEASGVFKNVAVVGCNQIGGSGTLAAPPYEWTIELPKDTWVGQCPLTAVGFGPAPQPVDSEPITILVELPEDAPMRLVAEDPELELHRADTGNQLIWGVFPDGQRVNLTNSSRISFKSSSPKVVSVDYRCVYVAVTPGSAKITLTYRDLHIDIPVTVLPDHER